MAFEPYMFKIPSLPGEVYKASNAQRAALDLTWWAYTIAAFKLMVSAPPGVVEKVLPKKKEPKSNG
jgi:hypothetical protein